MTILKKAWTSKNAFLFLPFSHKNTTILVSCRTLFNLLFFFQIQQLQIYITHVYIKAVSQ